jgi:hypothetical protein
MKPIIRTDKVINLLDAINYISELEAKEKGTKFTKGVRRYADDSTSFHRRFWDQVIEDQHGNQQFSNDSFYRFTCLGIADVEEYGEATDETKLFLKHFPDCVNDLEGNPYILFDVSW